MFWFWFAVYTMFLVLIFGFFIVAKIHTYKFRDYSILIHPVTKILGIILMVLALLGYYILWSGTSTGSTEKKTVGEAISTEIY